MLGSLNLAVGSWAVPRLGTGYQAGCLYIAPAPSILLSLYALYLRPDKTGTAGAKRLGAEAQGLAGGRSAFQSIPERSRGGP